MNEWEPARGRQLIVYLASQDLLAPVLQTPVRPRVPGSVTPPHLQRTLLARNVGKGGALLPFRMMGPKFRTWVWSMKPPLRNLVSEQVCRERGWQRNLSTRETECGPARGSGLHPSQGQPPASGWDLRMVEAGVVRRWVYVGSRPSSTIC